MSTHPMISRMVVVVVLAAGALGGLVGPASAKPKDCQPYEAQMDWALANLGVAGDGLATWFWQGMWDAACDLASEAGC